MDEKFSRHAIEALDASERRERLAELARLLSRRLAAFDNWEVYWREANFVIEELRAMGHDLWRHDWDGESRELWGWDYGRKTGTGLLQLQFRFRGEVKTFWRTENPMLGVETDDP